MKLKWPHHRWLIAIFLLAIVLRFTNLGAKSFWLDEAFSVLRGHPTLENADSNNPPLYYTSLYHWTRAVGSDEAMARLPSAIISVLNVGLLYLLARQLFSRDVALLAAGLLAVSPLNLWYAQEARMYTALAFVTLLMALGLAWRRRAGVLLFFVALSVGLYLGYLVFPLWVAISVLWLVLWWQRGHRPTTLLLWLAASAAAWWLYLPWWPHFERWLQRSLLSHWMFAPLRNFLGLAQFEAWHFILALLGAALLLLAAALLAPTILRRDKWRRLATIAVLVPFVLVVGLTPVPRLYGVKRVLVSGWPFVILLVSWLVLSIDIEGRRQAVMRGLLAFSLLCSLITLFLVPKDDWRSLTAYLNQNVESTHSIIWLDPLWNTHPLLYYDLQHDPQFGDLEELRAAAATSHTVWLVSERQHGRPAPTSPSERWLDRNWNLVEAIPFYRLELRHYRPQGDSK